MAQRGRPKKVRPEGEEVGRTLAFREVDEETRLTIKMYAIVHKITLGQALKALVADSVSHQPQSFQDILEEARSIRQQKNCAS